MPQITIAAPLVAATTYLLDTTNHELVIISSPLTVADTIAISIVLPSGSAAVAAPDTLGVLTGLSATVQARSYQGGPTYSIVKTGVASSVSCFADMRQHI